MIARPKRSEWREKKLDTVPARRGDGLFIVGVVEQPPSMAGRECTIWIPDDDIDDTLRLLRDAAIARRSGALGGAT